MAKIKVALISPICYIAKPEKNLKKFEKWVEKAASKGAIFIGFPELALSGYAKDPRIKNVAENIPGDTVKKLENMAKVNDVYISIGMLEKNGNKYYNSQVVVGPEGYLNCYRKHYPTPSEIEYLSTSPGKQYPIVLIDNIKFGINICADSRNIDTIDALAKKGVQIVHNPHSNLLEKGKNAEEWTRGKIAYYMERILRSRAHILINNMAGEVKDTSGNIYKYSSGALVLDPIGQVVIRTKQKDNKEKMIIQEIDTNLEKYIPVFELRQKYLKKIRRVRSEIRTINN